MLFNIFFPSINLFHLIEIKKLKKYNTHTKKIKENETSTMSLCLQTVYPG